MKKKYLLKQSGERRAFKNLNFVQDDLPTLPLVCKNAFHVAWEILESGIMPPEECDVFVDKGGVPQKLIYFYYGRSDYKVAAGNNSINYLFYPVCFLVEPANVEMEAVFPFDSGAYSDGLYKEYIPLKMDINEFSLKPNIQTIKGFVKYFFGNNRDYCNGRPKKFPISFDNSDELNAYLYLLNADGNKLFDSRSNAIEILSKKLLKINSNVKALILPDDCLYSHNRKKVIDKMIAAGIEIIPYEILGGGAEKQNEQVRTAVVEYLEKNNLL